MISDLLDAQEQVVKVDAFVYPVDVHKTCRRLSKKRKGIDGWEPGTRASLFSFSCPSSLRSERLGENVPSGGSQEGENLVSGGENMSAKIIFVSDLYQAH